MIRLPIRVLTLGLGVFLATCFFSAAALADVDYFIDQLTNATDFRVRTQAALALGASDDKAAVSPLCDALDDTNDTVRSAAAAALGRLKNPKGLPCLKAHLGESSPSVLSVIERSAKSLSGGQVGQATAARPERHLLRGHRSGERQDRSWRQVGFRCGARHHAREAALDTAAARSRPRARAGGAAKKIIKKHGSLTGYLLRTRVEPPRAEGDELIIQVGITMWTYPGGDLKGSFTPKLRMQGASPGDRESEDSLVKMAVENAVENFARQAASM